MTKQEIIPAPAVVEGEILTDQPQDAKTERLHELLGECENALDAILEVAQRIDHGMTEVRPNQPNREIVRIADATLASLRSFIMAQECLEDESDDTPLLKGLNHASEV